MRRTFGRFGCALVLLTACAGHDDSPEKHLPELPKLIKQLGDPDPQQRRLAQKELIGLHEIGRAAVRKARATAPCGARAGMDYVLLHTRWASADDPEQVRGILATYAEVPAEQRVALVGELAGVAPATLLKIIQADPSPAVRWAASIAMQGNSTFPGPYPLASSLTGLIDKTIHSDPDALLPADENAPLLAAAGWSLLESDADQATSLYSKVAELQRKDPTAFNGEMAGVYAWLVDLAERKHDYVTLIRLLREQAEFTPYNAYETPVPVNALLVAQAVHGPFPGILNDLRTYQVYLHGPIPLYALGKLAGRKVGHWAEWTLDALALAAGSPKDWELHYFTGYHLAQFRFAPQAQQEFAEVARLGGPQSFAYFYELANLAAMRSDDLHAAQYLEQALTLQDPQTDKLVRRYGGPGGNKELDDWFTCHIDYLRAATFDHDKTAMAFRLDKLKEIDQTGGYIKDHPAVAADIVPALQDVGRFAEADAMFESAYAALKVLAAKKPNDATAVNNLAWLCAHCGRHLPEAVKLADHAVALEPDESSLIDTQSETRAKSGDLRQALALEVRALELDPDNIYMAAQVRRLRQQIKVGKGPA